MYVALLEVGREPVVDLREPLACKTTAQKLPTYLGLDATMGRNLIPFHHHQGLDQSNDTRYRFAVADIGLCRAYKQALRI
jgi:hypothetical protein